MRCRTRWRSSISIDYISPEKVLLYVCISYIYQSHPRIYLLVERLRRLAAQLRGEAERRHGLAALKGIAAPVRVINRKGGWVDEVGGGGGGGGGGVGWKRG